MGEEEEEEDVYRHLFAWPLWDVWCFLVDPPDVIMGGKVIIFNWGGLLDRLAVVGSWLTGHSLETKKKKKKKKSRWPSCTRTGGSKYPRLVFH